MSARLRSVPLRVKLVASVLALVSAALVLIAVSSTLALRSYMSQRLDDELTATSSAFAQTVDAAQLLLQLGNDASVSIVSAAHYFMRITDSGGRLQGRQIGLPAGMTPEDLPTLTTGFDAILAEMSQGPHTVVSPSHKVHWRVIVVQLKNGSVLHMARDMSEFESAIARLIWADALIGGAVLIALAGVGAAIVRTSLRSLIEIEQTAAAIAGGDLTRRVPDPEPERVDPQTELGRLSRALNAMLAQIEMAFTARAQSETAARAAEFAARDAAAAAQESEARALRSEDRMRQFVADASHELRTPLTTIRGFAELYRQGAVPNEEAAKRLVRRIEDEASRMGLLVEDLLLLARLDRERPLTLAPVELPVLAVDAVQAARATAPERTIELDVQEGAALVAYGDDARLRQVIGNLMTNALVHTPAEALVTLRLRAEVGDTAVLEVVDTGPGMSSEQRERVFERFYRADAARTRKANTVNGTGLGLSIVAAIVAAHHGRVEVDGTPGGGTTFRVRLPLVPSRVDIAS